MYRRALAFASLFAFFGGVTSGTSAQVRGAVPVTLDFSPIGEAPVPASPRSSAPADVDFGSYPLSVLGIENVIRKADESVRTYAMGEARIDDGPIAYAIVAIRDWERRYPSDPWIAKDLLAIARFYEHVGTAESRTDAERAVAWMSHDYPHSQYAEAGTRMIADVSAPRYDRHVERLAPPPEPVAVAPAPPAYVPPAYVPPAGAWPTIPPYAVPEPARN